MSGRFLNPPMANLRCNPVGVLPEKDGGWRLITNLSAPFGHSVNSSIEHELCSVSYSSFNQAIQIILSQVKVSELCKMDLSSAFRLIPIHPSDFCLLGMFIDEKYYFEKYVIWLHNRLLNF